MSALNALRDIALDDSRLVAERQRAIDAITLFPEYAVAVFDYIVRKTDLAILKERATLYSKRIKDGTTVNFTA
jgi:hypothetical protein